MKNSFEIMLGLEYPESKAIYDETNQQIEKFSGIIYLVTVRGTPICLVFPKFIACLFVYFTTNLGKGALELPLPMWYV